MTSFKYIFRSIISISTPATRFFFSVRCYSLNQKKICLLRTLRLNRIVFIRSMPTSSPVYQPTTVTYESTSPPERWSNRPVSYLSATVSRTARGPCGSQCFPSRGCLPYALLALGLLTLAAGIAMIVEGSLQYNADIKRESGDKDEVTEVAGNTADLVIAIAGGIFIIVALILLGK